MESRTGFWDIKVAWLFDEAGRPVVCVSISRTKTTSACREALRHLQQCELRGQPGAVPLHYKCSSGLRFPALITDPQMSAAQPTLPDRWLLEKSDSGFSR